MQAINVRHNFYGVDVIGAEDNVHRAMGALNSQPDLYAACEAAMNAMTCQIEMCHAQAAQSRDRDARVMSNEELLANMYAATACIKDLRAALSKARGE